MKVLVFSDLHSNKQALIWLDKLLADGSFDLVISPGDIVTMGDTEGKSYAQFFADVAAKHNVALRVVFGNNDPDEVIAWYEFAGISLHNKSYRHGGLTFVGIGDIESHPDRMIDPLQLEIGGNILVTHRPPVQLKRTAFRNAPSIHIAGHLHSQGFVKQVGKTLVVNAPAATDGGAAILSLPDKKVEFVRQ